MPITTESFFLGRIGKSLDHYLRKYNQIFPTEELYRGGAMILDKWLFRSLTVLNNSLY